MEDRQIRILTDGPESLSEEIQSTGLNAMPSFETALRRTVEKAVSLSVDAIVEQLTSTYKKVTETIGALPPASSGCKLQTVSFTLTISSSGEVSLLSTAKGKLDGVTGLTFVIARTE